jgi:hypothetical protein
LEAKSITVSRLNHNGKSSDQRWASYIEAMRGPLSSIPVDRQKVDAMVAQKPAETRFFQGSNQRSVNRSALHLTKMLKRQSG